jgi:hypothetical protein
VITMTYDDTARIHAAAWAYQQNFNGDPYHAMAAALEAADQLGGPHLARVDLVDKKLWNLRGIVVAAQSQIGMVLSELGNVERAVSKIRPGATPPCPTGCGSTDRLLSKGAVVGYICPNCHTTLAACKQCGVALTPPTGSNPYGPGAPLTTDCGGDCLACQHRIEREAGDPSHPENRDPGNDES